MGSIGAPEVIVIFVVALLVLGPDRLPGVARQMGKAMGEFRRLTSGFQDEVRRAIDDSDEPGQPSSYVPPNASAGATGTGTTGDAAPTPTVRPTIPVDELPPPPDDPSYN